MKTRKSRIVELLFLSLILSLPLVMVSATEGGNPSVRYVEFNGERKEPGETYIVDHGTTLHVVAALEESHKQSMKADLIFIDENDEARIFRMELENQQGIREWHQYYVDTGNLNPGPYRVRIRIWNMAKEASEEHGGVTSKEIIWGDLYLSLKVQQQERQPPRIPGYPRESVLCGVILASAVILVRKRKQC